jgi:uncharacterized protein YndB with AHSA1/START domain
MVDILHRVGISAPPEQVYEAVATTDGLSKWWTNKIEGKSSVGDSLYFFFSGPEPRAIMEVAELEPRRLVRWRCVGGPDEWVGTDLTFEVKQEGDETVVLFAHANWREPVEFMRHCSTKWGYLLLGLKAGLEGGPYRAYPDDEKISSWG